MDGLLIVDKPGGMTSHDVVAIVRRAAQEKSVGHLGTLDPMASGVLPLMLGNYTRLAQFFNRADKAYEGEIRFGFATDTWDAEGEPVGEIRPADFTGEQLQTAVAALCGTIEQVPPVYSAKKIDGTPAYKLARKGIVPEMKPVRIEVTSFHAERTGPETARFAVTVSSGGYIRALAHCLGETLGCGAHLSALRRTRAGEFVICGAHSIDAIKASSQDERSLRQMLVPFRDILPGMPSIAVNDSVATKLLNGMPVNLSEFTAAPMVKLLTRPDRIIGIARRQAMTLFAPHIMFAIL